jgi:arsenite methyltransferase
MGNASKLAAAAVDEAQIRAALSWAGCIAGALTMDEYRQLLREAGFDRVSIDVDQCYTRDDLLRESPDALSALPTDIATQLVGRFTSSGVTAWKPMR